MMTKHITDGAVDLHTESSPAFFALHITTESRCLDLGAPWAVVASDGDLIRAVHIHCVELAGDYGLCGLPGNFND